ESIRGPWASSSLSMKVGSVVQECVAKRGSRCISDAECCPRRGTDGAARCCAARRVRQDDPGERSEASAATDRVEDGKAAADLCHFVLSQITHFSPSVR